MYCCESVCQSFKKDNLYVLEFAACIPAQRSLPVRLTVGPILTLQSTCLSEEYSSNMATHIKQRMWYENSPPSSQVYPHFSIHGANDILTVNVMAKFLSIYINIFQCSKENLFTQFSCTYSKSRAYRVTQSRRLAWFCHINGTYTRQKIIINLCWTTNMAARMLTVIAWMRILMVLLVGVGNQQLIFVRV